MVLSSDRWQRLESLFYEALALGPLDREAFLKERCAGDAEYRNHERSVEVVVPHFAGRFGHKRAAVACRTVKPASLHAPARHVLGTDGII